MGNDVDIRMVLSPTSLSGGIASQAFMKSDVDIQGFLLRRRTWWHRIPVLLEGDVDICKDLYSNAVIWWLRIPVLHEERRR